MNKKSKLSNARQKLAIEYMPLVRVLARYFCSCRPAWQRENMLPDLEGEGYLALSKAAITYDKKRLPYPKAYFARAVLNAMLKHVKRSTRTPGEQVTIAEAELDKPHHDELEHLRLAIEDLDPADREFAISRFLQSKTLRTLAEETDCPVRLVSLRNRRLVTALSHALGIRLSSPSKVS